MVDEVAYDWGEFAKFGVADDDAATLKVGRADGVNAGRHGKPYRRVGGDLSQLVGRKRFFSEQSRLDLHEVLNAALDAMPVSWDEGDNAKVSSASIAELLKGGLDAEQALDLLQLKWQAVAKHADEPHTPETDAQRAFVRAWARRPR